MGPLKKKGLYEAFSLVPFKAALRGHQKGKL